MQDLDEYCPVCGELMTIIYDNTGYEKPDPEHYEVVGYLCQECGYREEI